MKIEIKNTLIVLFSFCTFVLFGQGNCFEDCRANLNKPLDSITHSDFDSNEKMNLEKALERNQKITDGLIGCKAPGFTVKSVEGKHLSSSALLGKVIVLNFWFTTCSPCVAEMPSLNKLVADYNDTSIAFIAFSTDDTLVIKRFLKNKKFDYNIVSSEYNMREKFCILGYPTNMVIDKKGIVRQIFHGGKTDDRAKTEAYDLLKPTIDKCLTEN